VPELTQQQQLERVRRYWNETNEMYLRHVGLTFQAGYLQEEGKEADPVTSNRMLAGLAGIRNGDRVLDAGCGVGGPAIDMATEIEGISVVGVTISPEQARVANQRILAAHLSHRVSVTVADFHAFAFPDESFDMVLFFESAGYSHDPKVLYAEAKRVLRPGGRVLVKDVCCKEGPLSQQESDDLSTFDENVAYLTRRTSEVTAAMQSAGLVDIVTRDITPVISKKHQIKAMFEDGDVFFPTEFGRRHVRYYPNLPTIFVLISARRSL
jgi:ubiquinone/menaquinone biosynthesis C-methylase UbiE